MPYAEATDSSSELSSSELDSGCSVYVLTNDFGREALANWRCFFLAFLAFIFSAFSRFLAFLASYFAYLSLSFSIAAISVLYSYSFTFLLASNFAFRRSLSYF